MKKYAKLFIAFVLVLSAFLLAGCSIINHLEYELYEFTDDSYYEVSDFLEIYPSKKVNIPAKYKGLPVKSIGDFAFEGCDSLTYNVYDNAKYLGNKQNPYLALITATDTSVTSCEIHEQTKVIAGSAFEFCSNLTSITIPDSVTRIGNHTFAYCCSLKGITISDNVIKIANGAFEYCSSLTSVTIGKGVIEIDVYAFKDCSSLQTITFTGTQEQWDSIAKDDPLWDYNCPVKVVCTG